MEVELMMFVNSVKNKVQTKWDENPFERYASMNNRSESRNFVLKNKLRAFKSKQRSFVNKDLMPDFGNKRVCQTF